MFSDMVSVTRTVDKLTIVMCLAIHPLHACITVRKSKTYDDDDEPLGTADRVATHEHHLSDVHCRHCHSSNSHSSPSPCSSHIHLTTPPMPLHPTSRHLEDELPISSFLALVSLPRFPQPATIPTTIHIHFRIPIRILDDIPTLIPKP